MSRRKTLAEELAELANPAPTNEFDPEADPFGAGPAVVDSDDELAAADLRKGRGKEKSRLRGDITLDDAAYAGRRSSRAALFGDEDDQQQEVEEDGGLEEEREGPEEEAEQRADGEVEGLGELGHSRGEAELGSPAGSSSEGEEEEEEAGRKAASSGSDQPSGSDSDADEQASEKEADQDGGGLYPAPAAGAAAAAQGHELAALEREYGEARLADEAALTGLRARAARERSKALAVAAQRSLWQRSTELRILLQRCLQGANRLPRPAMQRAAAAAQPGLAEAYGSLAADAAETVAQLCELLGSLAQQNPAVQEAAAAAGVAGPAAGQKRRRAQAGGEALQEGQSDALWQQLDAEYAALAPFRDASLDRWHRKTVLAAASTARSGALRALNQSVSSQVQALLRDPQRLLQRSRVQPGQLRVLCDPPATQGALPSSNAVDNTAAATAQAQGSEPDADTYDDADFYAGLLRECLEAGSAGGAGGPGWYSGPKQRKAVDRRASKGRRLRYHVHEKLVGFMAPADLQTQQLTSHLLSNLFGGAGANGKAAA